MKNRIKFCLWIVGAGSIAIGLAGCGNNSEDEATAPAPSGSTNSINTTTQTPQGGADQRVPPSTTSAKPPALP